MLNTGSPTLLNCMKPYFERITLDSSNQCGVDLGNIQIGGVAISETFIKVSYKQRIGEE